MTEYWKSNARKFCDFCKCWIADNRPSIEFHERGKKHKLNVEQKVDAIAKKGKEDHDNKLKEDDYMKAMETAALRAYKEDLEKNPDMTGIEITDIAKASNAKIVIGSSVHAEKPKQMEPKWQEVKAPNGSSYYWHIDSGETSWDAPKEGFLSLKEKKRRSQVMPKNKKEDNHKPKNNKVDDHKPKKDFSKSKKSIAPPKIEVPPPIEYGPVNRGQPYGTWKTAFEPVIEIDLQLPYLPEPDIVIPEVVIKKPKITFDEKVVTLSNSSSNRTSAPVFFKKRKGNEEHKKNVRNRLDD